MFDRSDTSALFAFDPTVLPNAWNRTPLSMIGVLRDEVIRWLAHDTRRARTVVGLSQFTHAGFDALAPRNVSRLVTLETQGAMTTPVERDRRYAAPGVYGESAVAFDAARRVVCDWGGSSQATSFRGPTEGLRRFAVDVGRWQPVEESGEVPHPRIDAASVFDDARDRILVFGGHSALGPEPSNALLELKPNAAGTGAAWRTIPTSGDAPPATSGSVVTIEDDVLWLFGGASVETNGTRPETVVSRSNQAWRIRIDSEPAAWERVDDGQLPYLRFFDDFSGDDSPTRGVRVPGLGLLAVGGESNRSIINALYAVSLTVPPIATRVELPGGLFVDGSRIGFDAPRSRLIHLRAGVTHAIPVVDGVLGAPQRLCAVGGRGMEWSFPIEEGLLAGSYRMDGHVRLLEAATPVCAE